jgi:hypothetical protein
MQSNQAGFPDIIDSVVQRQPGRLPVSKTFLANDPIQHLA